MGPKGENGCKKLLCEIPLLFEKWAPEHLLLEPSAERILLKLNLWGLEKGENLNSCILDKLKNNGGGR